MRHRTTSRRSVLKTGGPIALLGVAGATGLASASTLDVGTDGSSDVDSTSATLHGTVYDLGDSDTVYVQFAFENTSNGTTRYTDHEARSSTGSFSHDVSDLNSGTTYDFYARAESEDGSTVDTGQTLQFTTDSGGGGDDDDDDDDPDEDLE